MPLMQRPPLRSNARALSPSVMALAIAVYVGIPLVLEFTPYSLLGYRAIPHEFYHPDEHDVLSTHNVCRGDECDQVPYVWKDRRSGDISRYDDFSSHRREEAQSLALRWFLYGLIACIGTAIHRERSACVPLLQTFAYGVFADTVLALLVYGQVVL